ncbi:MAG TPA: hypothetical protein VJ179_01290, partial [Patescibacteria group bacterium]|nr:hypothetical protein [Patescibacteria group bacterium]
MKIFFIGTPRGNLDHARVIYKATEELGYEHTTDFMLRIDPAIFYDVDEKMWQERYRSRLREITEADICVFEVSIHSLAVGQLIQEAIRREKPVIALYYQGQKPYFLRGAEGSETRVQLIEYTLDNLKDILADAFEIANELLTTRFTMLMPPDMTKFLDKVTEEKGTARSEYIRELIAREMRKG